MKEFNLIRTDLYQSPQLATPQLATSRISARTVATSAKFSYREAQKNPGTPYGDLMLVFFGALTAYMIFSLFEGFFVKH